MSSQSVPHRGSGSILSGDTDDVTCILGQRRSHRFSCVRAYTHHLRAAASQLEPDTHTHRDSAQHSLGITALA